MFATQQYMEMGPDHAKKRPRDDQTDRDAQDVGSASFSEHRNKRLQCLPLRTSPRTAQQTLPSTVTPLDSHYDLPHSHFVSEPQQDAEVDMMDSVKSSHLEVTDSRNAANRMPTPIQPSFAAQVRGQNCEWAGPGPSQLAMNGVTNMGHHQTGFSDANSVPRMMANEADWHAVHNNRRLPSPISESEDSSPGMMLDGNNAQNQLSTQLQNSSISSHSPHMEHPNAMDLEPLQSSQSADGDADPNSPSPGRKGHMRSKHTVNSWTWQPGMKRSFSIGYRSDCEKCRLKVPGHFNHIIVS